MTKYVLDTETGGLSPETDALCSISIKLFNNSSKDILTIYIKPTKLKYNARAMKVNGLTKKFLRENGVTEKQAIAKLRDYVSTHEKGELIGQNVKFDYAFLEALFKRHDEKFDLFSHRMRDTLTVALFLKDAGYIDPKSMHLEDLYKEQFNKSIKDHHTSEADILATEKLYKEYLMLLE